MFAPEHGLVTILVQRLLAAAEPGQVLGQMPGGLGHKVAGVPHDLPPHLFVFEVLGFFHVCLQDGIDILAFVGQVGQSMWLMPR